jgi:hypothetical protein
LRSSQISSLVSRDLVVIHVGLDLEEEPGRLIIVTSSVDRERISGERLDSVH